MAKLNATLADVSTEFVPLPEEEYLGRITEVEVGKSKSKKDMVTVVTTIQDGDFKGRKIYEYFVFQTDKGEPNEASLRRFKKLIENLLGEDRANDPDFDTDELKDQDCRVYVIQGEPEKYQGEDRIPNKIKRWLPA